MSNAQTQPELSAPRNYRTVYWYPSLRCNLACKHCWVKSSPTADTSRDLSTEEALQVVEKIREFGAFAILSGGEILFRQDALIILQALIDARVDMAVETNGLLICGQFIEMVVQARASGLRVNVAISMDGGTAEAHEWMRGRNTFDRTLKAMQLLKDAGIGFDVQCILHRGNAGTVTQLFEQMARFAPEPHQLIFGFLNPVGRGLQIADDWGLNDAEREEACGVIAAGMSRYPGRVCVKTPPALIPPRYFARLFSHQGQCYCSTACAFPTLGILPNGNITICALTGDDPSMNFGNIRTSSLAQIWKEVRMDEVRHKYVEAKLTGICSDCVFRAMCKGSCRAHAYEEFGEFNAPHPLCDTLFKRGEFPDAYRLTALHERTAPKLEVI